ncbi:uncharacterized protein LOC128673867 [Plodia interpunctella]|uniref:uncharacterized protein LOC128673867 n=1 Tax=Plodia interpunctella TaxID=58824 RepID=UPI002368148C|nr:uncharacterized protein LOC128673867 [Plodia interpunctella]
MIAEAGVWSAAALVVLAACWPVAAEFKLRQVLCHSMNCDYPDTPDEFISKEELVKNITDILGLRLSNIANEEDPFNNLLDQLDLLEQQNYPNHPDYRRKPFVYSWEVNRINLFNRPQYAHTKAFPTINMEFVPYPSQIGFLYTAAPTFMDLMVPQQKPEFTQYVVPEAFTVSQFNVKLKTQGVCSLLALLSGPLTFVLALLTTAVLLFYAWKVALHRTIFQTRKRRHFDRKCECHRKCCLAIILLTALSLYICGLWGFHLTEQQMEDGVQNITVAICNYTRSLCKNLHDGSIIPKWLRVKPWEKLPEPPIPKREYDAFIDHWFHYNKESIFKWTFRRSTITSLMSIARQMDDVHPDLVSLKEDGAILWYLADQLKAELQEVKRTLLHSLESCAAPACVELQWKHHIMQFNTNTPHVQIPDLTKVLDTVTNLRDQGLYADVAEGLRSYHYVDARLDLYQTHTFAHYREALNIAWKLGHVYLHRYWFTIQKMYLVADEIDAYRMKILNEYLPLISKIFFWIICILLVRLTS